MKKSIYFDKMEIELNKVSAMEKKPALLLHSCCAPCSSAVLELLIKYFDITVYYYNPNIYPEDEYYKRSEEQERFCREYFKDYNIEVISEKYNEADFSTLAKGMENVREGGERCTACFRLRLEKTALYARKYGYEYFTSTLSVSPLKDTKRLNEIGENLEKEYGVKFLYNDFKKNDGYKRSVEISAKTGMYRQDWCGCRYSYMQRIIDSAKGFAFDLDGTLTDTMTFYEDFAANLVRHFGGEPACDIRDRVRLMTTEEACVYLVEEYKLPNTPEELLAHAYEQFEVFYGKEAKLKDGVLEFLDYAQKRGKKLSIASATTRRYIELVLKSNGVFDKFQPILSAPDLKMYKNKPDIYYKAADDMGIKKEELVVFEDAHHAVQTAKRGGLKVAAVYDVNAEKFVDIIKAEADIYVNSMAELIFE